MKQLLAFILVTCIVLTSLSACGQNGSPESAQQGSAAGESQTAPAEKEGDITIWHSFTQENRSAFVQEMADKYTAANPKVKFHIEVYPWATFDTKWKTALNSGTLPDLSTALPEHVVMMNQAEALSPLNDFVKEMDPPFIQKPIDILTKDGNTLAVPFYAHARVLWARKDILDKNGLAVPETLEDLMNASKKIAESGEMYGLAVPMKKTDFYGTIYLNIVAKSKGAYLLTKDGKADLTSPKMIESIKYLVDMYKAGSPEGSINYGDPETNDSFIQGKAAFYFESGFAIDRVRSGNPEIADNVIAVAPPKDSTTGESGWFADYITFVVWKGKQEAVAKDFLKTLYVPEDYVKFLHLVPGGMIPALQGLDTSEVFLDNDVIRDHQDDIAIIKEGVEKGTPIGADFGLDPAMNVLKSMGIIEEMFQNIVMNNVPVEEAAKKAEDAINTEIALIH